MPVYASPSVFDLHLRCECLHAQEWDMYKALL